MLALGALGALLFGLGGAAVGAALDRNLREGLPKDELYVYEDALRRGKTVVIALGENEEEAARAAAPTSGPATNPAARPDIESSPPRGYAAASAAGIDSSTIVTGGWSGIVLCSSGSATL